MLRFATILVTTVGLALPSWAEPPVRPADRARLEASEVALGQALRGALMEGARAEVAVLTEALAGVTEAPAPVGDWNCRMLKLGGLGPLTVYGNFRCRITEITPYSWRIEKLTGSQRFVGEITELGGATIYLGVAFVEGGPAVEYAGLPPLDQAPVWPGQTVAQVGFFEQPEPDRARLLLPAPLLESDFDILYLTR